MLLLPVLRFCLGVVDMTSIERFAPHCAPSPSADAKLAVILACGGLGLVVGWSHN